MGARTHIVSISPRLQKTVNAPPSAPLTGSGCQRFHAHMITRHGSCLIPMDNMLTCKAYQRFADRVELSHCSKAANLTLWFFFSNNQIKKSVISASSLPRTKASPDEQDSSNYPPLPKQEEYVALVRQIQRLGVYTWRKLTAHSITWP